MLNAPPSHSGRLAVLPFNDERRVALDGESRAARDSLSQILKAVVDVRIP